MTLNYILNVYINSKNLEHFDASLKLFEKMMPTVFKGAPEAYQSDCTYIIM